MGANFCPSCGAPILRQEARYVSQQERYAPIMENLRRCYFEGGENNFITIEAYPTAEQRGSHVVIQLPRMRGQEQVCVFFPIGGLTYEQAQQLNTLAQTSHKDSEIIPDIGFMFYMSESEVIDFIDYVLRGIFRFTPDYSLKITEVNLE